MNTTWETQVLSQHIHTLVGGKGSAVVLLPGWPQTAEAYGEIFPLLAQHHKVLAMDPPGLGDSAPSTGGYDTAHIARVLADAAKCSLDAPYHLVGHDVGAWIAYAWAAQFPEVVKSLTLLDASIPGCSTPRTFPLELAVDGEAQVVKAYSHDAPYSFLILVTALRFRPFVLRLRHRRSGTVRAGPRVRSTRGSNHIRFTDSRGCTGQPRRGRTAT